MTAATLLAMVLISGGIGDPCGCGADKPLRPRGIVGHGACDGGKCFSCQRPLFGPSAPPFDYRLIYNYPWSQKPCCPAHQPVPHSAEEIGEPVPMPLPEPPADAGAASVQGTGIRSRISSRLRPSESASH